MNRRKWNRTSARCLRPTLAACALTLLGAWAPVALGASAVGDPPIPAMPAAATADPFTAPTGGNIGITLDRNIRQTFQNAATFTVGEIITAFDVTGGQGGFQIRFFEVDDVNATSWNSTGVAANPLATINYYDSLPATTQRLGFLLTSSEQFVLPARNTGTQGYAAVFTNLDGFSNPGQFRHSNNTETDPLLDLYPAGRYYTQTGSSPNGIRDLGLWLVAASGATPGPGDVDGMNGVNLDDLAIIAANFRTSGGRSEGDLTGNGFIDLFDFRQWKANYPGANTGPGAGGFAGLFSIPEPASSSIVLLALLHVSSFRRRDPRHVF